MSVCLDSFALLAWLQNEAGATLVEEHLDRAGEDAAYRCHVSVINLGEVLYWIVRRKGQIAAESFWQDATRGVLPVSPIEATRRRVREAALLKGRHPIAYADAFALQAARELGLPLITGDPKIRAAHVKEGVELLWIPTGAD